MNTRAVGSHVALGSRPTTSDLGDSGGVGESHCRWIRWVAQFRQLSIAVVSMFFSVEAVLDFVEWVEAGTGGGRYPTTGAVAHWARVRLRVLPGRKAGQGTHRVPAWVHTYLHRAQADGTYLGLDEGKRGEGGFWQP